MALGRDASTNVQSHQPSKIQSDDLEPENQAFHLLHNGSEPTFTAPQAEHVLHSDVCSLRRAG